MNPEWNIPPQPYNQYSYLIHMMVLNMLPALLSFQIHLPKIFPTHCSVLLSAMNYFHPDMLFYAASLPQMLLYSNLFRYLDRQRMAVHPPHLLSLFQNSSIPLILEALLNLLFFSVLLLKARKSHPLRPVFPHMPDRFHQSSLLQLPAMPQFV